MLNCYALSGPLIRNCSKCILNDDWLCVCVCVQNLDLNVDLSAASAAEE